MSVPNKKSLLCTVKSTEWSVHTYNKEAKWICSSVAMMYENLNLCYLLTYAQQNVDGFSLLEWALQIITISISEESTVTDNYPVGASNWLMNILPFEASMNLVARSLAPLYTLFVSVSSLRWERQVVAVCVLSCSSNILDRRFWNQSSHFGVQAPTFNPLSMYLGRVGHHDRSAGEEHSSGGTN